MKTLKITEWEEAVIYRALKEYFAKDVRESLKRGVTALREDGTWYVPASVEGRTAKEIVEKFNLTYNGQREENKRKRR